jgi:predicted RNase H-like nuclease
MVEATLCENSYSELMRLGRPEVAAESHYQQFCELIGEEVLVPSGGATGRKFTEVIQAANKHGRNKPHVIAVDMPISIAKIVGRRTADNAISRKFGAAKASTHSPSPERPGPFGRRMHQEIRAHGYQLVTSAATVRGRLSLMEVYPHCALIRLVDSPERLEYKCTKTTKYWPGQDRQARLRLLRSVWRRIADALDREIDGAGAKIESMMREAGPLKHIEDVIDAIVCAWVGVCFLKGEAEPYGDDDSAIWVPAARNS